MPNIVHSMKEWAYTFGSVSKEQWIRQIESDLKQKTIASLQSEWWPGEPLMPLLHRDDINEEAVSLPSSLFAQPPLIAECISTSGQQASAINQQILDALRQDTRSLILYSSDDSELYDAEWFTGVFKDLITVSYQMDEFKVSTLQQLEESGSNDLIRISREASSPSLEKLLPPTDRDHALLHSVRFIYRIESSGNWDVKTAAVINRLIEDMNGWTKIGFQPGAFLEKCILSLEADKGYFKHIIQARVLHLLWYNLHAQIIPSSVELPGQYLESHIYESAQESPDHYLIRASMSALAASLAGSQTVCIHHSSRQDIPVFYKRANRNIHHLLQLESSMYKGVDPMSGAYSIDFYTRSWTRKIWNSLRL
ncbi:MAG TPA: methylmalonyl-CoA mutase family protein [Saprospiraceae bacterium]|nr:methylmalonyl-CoA mutase family protein [Saprospiraceae bacterium]